MKLYIPTTTKLHLQHKMCLQKQSKFTNSRRTKRTKIKCPDNQEGKLANYGRLTHKSH